MADEEPRSLQQVVPVCDRVRCTDWVKLKKALHGSKGLSGRAVDFFPALFRSSDRRVNMNKARDWWNKREHTAAKLAEPNQLKYSTASQRVRHQFVVKALGGRGRQLGAHWEWLYPLMLVEFQRLRRAGVKMSNQLVAEMGVVFIEDSEHHVFNVRLSVNGKPFANLLTPRQIQDFLERYNIVYRRHKSKKQVSEEKQMEIDRAVARHLGRGSSNARILCPMLIFKNKKSSYPILNLPNTVSGVCYRSSPTAFINSRLMAEWLQEPRCWGHAGPFTSTRTLWMDNASVHCGSDVKDTARELRATVRLFPANATDKVQPADRFPIQRIKEHWRRLAERRNIEAIRKGDWKAGSASSGKLANPGKKIFLNLAAECIKLVNEEKDRNGVNWAKKSMIQCGLDVPSDGVWKVGQLSKELKAIVELYSDSFEEGYKEGANSVSL